MIDPDVWKALATVTTGAAGIIGTLWKAERARTGELVAAQAARIVVLESEATKDRAEVNRVQEARVSEAKAATLTLVTVVERVGRYLDHVGPTP